MVGETINGPYLERSCEDLQWPADLCRCERQRRKLHQLLGGLCLCSGDCGDGGFASASRLSADPERRETASAGSPLDRKSTRLNSSHVKISYAVFCLKKK